MDAWVLMSGGIDSTACAQFFINRGDKVTGIFVDYGQAARLVEYEAVTRVTHHLQIPLKETKFQCTNQFGEGEITGRNAFLIFAALVAISPARGVLSLGIHSGTEYYDCSTEFLSQIGDIVESYTGGAISLFCPFASKDKSFIYKYAEQTDVPIELTYSCEQGGIAPCGQCLSCGDRDALEAS